MNYGDDIHLVATRDDDRRTFRVHRSRGGGIDLYGYDPETNSANLIESFETPPKDPAPGVGVSETGVQKKAERRIRFYLGDEWDVRRVNPDRMVV